LGEGKKGKKDKRKGRKGRKGKNNAPEPPCAGDLVFGETQYGVYVGGYGADTPFNFPGPRRNFPPGNSAKERQEICEQKCRDNAFLDGYEGKCVGVGWAGDNYDICYGIREAPGVRREDSMSPLHHNWNIQELECVESKCTKDAICNGLHVNFQGANLPHMNPGPEQTKFCKAECEGYPAYSVGNNLCRCCDGTGSRPAMTYSYCPLEDARKAYDGWQCDCVWYKNGLDGKCQEKSDLNLSQCAAACEADSTCKAISMDTVGTTGCTLCGVVRDFNALCSYAGAHPDMYQEKYGEYCKNPDNKNIGGIYIIRR
jgi:hypothetical protein